MKINKKILITIMMTLLTAYVSDNYDLIVSGFVATLYYGMCLSGEYVYQKIQTLKLNLNKISWT